MLLRYFFSKVISSLKQKFKKYFKDEYLYWHMKSNWNLLFVRNEYLCFNLISVKLRKAKVTHLSNFLSIFCKFPLKSRIGREMHANFGVPNWNGIRKEKVFFFLFYFHRLVKNWVWRYNLTSILWYFSSPIPFMYSIRKPLLGIG